MKRILPLLLILAVLVFASIYYFQFRKPRSETGEREWEVQIMQENLDTPWEVAIGPDKKIYITERRGSLKIIDEGKVTTLEVPSVTETSEGGLLGMALHPNFSQNRQIYLYKTTGAPQDLTNLVERYTLNNNQLLERKIIIDNIPASAIHDGGRIVFGPDNFLYVTTGDAGQPSLAQDRNSLAGKILRVTAEGAPARGNPFNNRIYTLGHRNPEGLAWDKKGQLWSTEHGATANDELNRIEAGKNYGWPVIQGTQVNSGLDAPAITSGRGEAWAPAGLAFINNRLYFGGLRGMALFSVEVADSSVRELLSHFENQYGRIRDVTVNGEDLYFTTSNRDGRGIPRIGDDKIIKIRFKR